MEKKNRLSFLVGLTLVLIFSGFVYFFKYGQPPALFWDENYHLASAEKYLGGVMFMEPHPPLGKMLIALGELVWNQNSHLDKTSFLITDYVNSVPDGFSFLGFRFFPTLCAALAAVFFYICLYLIFRHWLIAFICSSIYLFDNALIVHCRGAMLEGIQLFFILSSICIFLLFLPKKSRNILHYTLLGLTSGLACAVKLNSAILLLLFLAWQVEDLLGLGLQFRFKSKFPFFIQANNNWNDIPLKQRSKELAKIILNTFGGLASFLFIFLFIFYLHFAFGQKIVAERYYEAQKEYREALITEQTASLKYFPAMLADYFSYFANYEKGVPAWDPEKPGENGSPPWAWPLGYKSINYRWDSTGEVASYIYLQGNPLSWAIGLLSIFLSFAYLAGRILFKAPIRANLNFRLIFYFFCLYLSYMLVMLNIKRVMYLYHYFIPLIFSFFLAALLFQFFYQKAENKKRFLAIAIILALAVVAVFLFFSPFTYHLPLSTQEFMQRVWTNIWRLTPVTN